MYTARVKFERGEEIRYISHLDMQRMVQRILRRGQIPMKYSEGFNPHPKLSFAMALAVGMTSQCEYFDVELETRVEPEVFLQGVNAYSPKGFKVTKAFITDEKLPSLTSLVEESEYRITIPARSEEAADEILENMKKLLEQDQLLQKKRNKKGKYVERNVRPLIRSMVGERQEKLAIVVTSLACGSVENLRPEALFPLLDPEDTLIEVGEVLEIHRTFLGKARKEELF